MYSFELCFAFPSWHLAAKVQRKVSGSTSCVKLGIGCCQQPSWKRYEHRQASTLAGPVLGKYIAEACLCHTWIAINQEWRRYSIPLNEQQQASAQINMFSNRKREAYLKSSILRVTIFLPVFPLPHWISHPCSGACFCRSRVVNLTSRKPCWPLYCSMAPTRAVASAQASHRLLGQIATFLPSLLQIPTRSDNEDGKW